MSAATLAATSRRSGWLRRLTGGGSATTSDMIGRHRLPSTWLAAPNGTPAGTELPGRLLAGPGGVFWIHTIRRHGTMRVSNSLVANDQEVAGCRRDAALIGQAITARSGVPTLVHPVIVVEGADVQVIDQPIGVTVVASSLLRNYLLAQPTVLRDAIAHRAIRAAGG